MSGMMRESMDCVSMHTVITHTLLHALARFSTPISVALYCAEICMRLDCGMGIGCAYWLVLDLALFCCLMYGRTPWCHTESELSCMRGYYAGRSYYVTCALYVSLSHVLCAILRFAMF
jgi:hypothetical protein